MRGIVVEILLIRILFLCVGYLINVLKNICRNGLNYKLKVCINKIIWMYLIFKKKKYCVKVLGYIVFLKVLVIKMIFREVCCIFFYEKVYCIFVLLGCKLNCVFLKLGDEWIFVLR